MKTYTKVNTDFMRCNVVAYTLIHGHANKLFIQHLLVFWLMNATDMHMLNRLARTSDMYNAVQCKIVEGYEHGLSLDFVRFGLPGLKSPQ